MRAPPSLATGRKGGGQTSWVRSRGATFLGLGPSGSGLWLTFVTLQADGADRHGLFGHRLLSTLPNTHMHLLHTVPSCSPCTRPYPHSYAHLCTCLHIPTHTPAHSALLPLNPHILPHADSPTPDIHHAYSSSFLLISPLPSPPCCSLTLDDLACFSAQDSGLSEAEPIKGSGERED